MTSNVKTLYDDVASTSQGSAELAAARAASRVARLMGSAHKRSGVSQTAMAEALRVSKGRISQLLNGDGNVKVSSLAKVLDALGYELSLEAKPKNDSVPELTRRSATRANVSTPPADHVWAWKQHFASGEGITCVVLLMDEIDGEHTALDRPRLMSPEPILRATAASDAKAHAWSIARRGVKADGLQPARV